jgi:hypothetical protein
LVVGPVNFFILYPVSSILNIAYLRIGNKK